ncbi:MAG: hypothetical protein KIS92_25850 [Planctomycetota bacterium]|nr:hypothetical protein [Planctomycetota bacterium]
MADSPATAPDAAPRTPITLADCEICSRLSDYESAFEKYADPSATRSWPPEGDRLAPVPEGPGAPTNHGFRRCPVCGMFYAWDYTYEYLANGSEDEWTLTRLTPGEARKFLSDAEYAARIARQQAEAASPEARNRHYAAQCLTVDGVLRASAEPASGFLRSGDEALRKGALAAARRIVDHDAYHAGLTPLAPALRELLDAKDAADASMARYVLRWSKPG